MTVKSTATPLDAVEGLDGLPDARLRSRLRSGQPATVSATVTRDPAVGPTATSRTMPRSTIDAVQLGVLDRAQGLDDLVGQGGHGPRSSGAARTDLHYGDR